MKKERIIFVYPSLYTFIKTEIELLSESFQLIYIDQKWSKKVLLPFNFIVQFFFLITNLHKVDTILVSFGGYNSFLPALLGNLFGKKVAIVVHGTDCVSFPEINYGNLRSPLLSYFTKKSYQWASIILPVSESLVYTENNYFSYSGTLKFGYTHHLLGIKTPYKIIPNGVDGIQWMRDKSIVRDENSFVTVLAKGKEKIKGVDLIIKAANSFPDLRFYLAGIENSDLGKIPDNIICKGRLSSQELRILYNESQFYFQLSSTEGFGVALCEAMLCGCIPIVSDVNHLPTIVGDTGFVLKKRDLVMLLDLISVILNSDLSNLEGKARSRILDNFSVANRERLLTSTLRKS